MTRKKPSPKKRQHVVDADGWTHVARGPRNNKALILSDGAEPSSSAAFDASAFAAKHTDCTRRWRESAAYVQSADFIRSTVLSIEGAPIDRCICLGLGSLNPDESPQLQGPDPRRSLSQLVAFESWVELFKERCSIDRILFQDPSFRSSDRAYLEKKGYEVVERPACEDLVSSSTFLYASYTPIEIVPRILGKAYPAVLICAELQHIGEGNQRLVVHFFQALLFIDEGCTSPSASVMLP